MANKEKEQVEIQDPIVESVGTEEFVSVETQSDEGVEASEAEVDWETGQMFSAVDFVEA